LGSALALALIASPAIALPASSCNVYKLDLHNAIGHRQGLDRLEPETIRFDGADVYVTRGRQTSHLTSTSTGTGINSRTAIADDGNPEESFEYAFYALGEHARPGTPKTFLLVDGDLYWPDCSPPRASAGGSAHSR